MKRGLVRLAMASGAALVPGAALAQNGATSAAIVIDPSLTRDDVAGTRTEPDLKQRPIAIGPLFGLPSLSVSGGFESNVFHRPSARSDFVATISPGFDLRYDEGRDSAELQGQATVRRFARFISENSEEFAVDFRNRLELDRASAFTARAGYARLIEPRSSAGSVPDAAEPVSFGRFGAQAGLRAGLGRLSLEPEAAFERLAYSPVKLESGGVADQSFRDTRTIHGAMTIAYDFSGFSLFVQGTGDHVESVSAPADKLRDANALSLAAGVRGTITSLLSGELAVGYQSRDYKSPLFGDYRGATFHADVQWFVTPLVTLRAQADREFRNSGNPRVAGVLASMGTLSAYYDLLRQLRLSFEGSFEVDRYRGAGTRATRKFLRGQAQYRLSRRISLGTSLSWLRQDVRGDSLVPEFSTLRAAVGLTVTP
ncbi:outer membrane beta-barrel protein [Novosphingobium sp. BL-8A]|uniref:outer membrane beta-barrel protein n=1 Tax=Novosphingobium sp. BL-8A TaxID=3127639 RepID=UPI0037575709